MADILVGYAEDHKLYLDAAVEKLEEREGLKVVVAATTGRQLIDSLKAKPFECVCILDIDMPDINGFDAVPIIRKHWPAMKILILSGYEFPGYLIRMVKLGVNGYFEKHCDIQDLAQAVFALRTANFHPTKVFPARLFAQIVKDEQPYPVLTATEQILLQHSVRSVGYKEIAREMGMGEGQIEHYRKQLYAKFKTNSRQSLVAKAYELGYLYLGK